MSKKNIILTITTICILAILISILAVSIIEKMEKNSNKVENGKDYGYVEDESEAEANKKLREIIEKLCESSEYKPYGKPFMMFAEVLRYPEYDIEYSEYDKFTSTDDEVWHCTRNSISEEYIGECIGKMTSKNNKEEYEIYKIEGISSEYAVAFKETDPACYMGLVNSENYVPQNLKNFIADVNLKNSDVEINMTFREQFQKGDDVKYGIMTFKDEDEYLWNNFLGDNEYIGEDFYSSYIDEFNIYIYHKTLKSIYSITINKKGNIDICSNYQQPYEFESTTEEAIKFIEYISENYEGYKEESPIQGPTLGDKNEFVQEY